MPDPITDGGTADSAGPVLEVTVAAPVDTVWQALRDPVQLRRWHGWDDESLDAEIQVIYLNDAVEDPPYRLVIGTGTFDLAETPDGVRVRLTRAPRGGNPEWDAYYDDITEGWTSFLQQLKYALERHPGEDRVTHYRSGAPLSPGRIEDRLGLTDVAGQPVGRSYKATLPGGDVDRRHRVLPHRTAARPDGRLGGATACSSSAKRSRRRTVRGRRRWRSSRPTACRPPNSIRCGRDGIAGGTASSGQMSRFRLCPERFSSPGRRPD